MCLSLLAENKESHDGLVRRKWTHNPTERRGRPKIDMELERLIVRIAKGNGTFGYGMIHSYYLNMA